MVIVFKLFGQEQSVTASPESDDYKKLLLCNVETDVDTSLKNHFEKNGFDVIVCGVGVPLLAALKSDLPDAVIIGQKSADINGKNLAEVDKTNFNGPVMLLSSKNEPVSEVNALNSGFDDFLTSDMGLDLLLARVQARLRAYYKYLKNNLQHQNRLTFGDLTIDKAIREAWLNESPIELTGAEFDLLWLLTSHAGQVMTREEIFHRLRGIEYDGQDRSVDVRVSRIRPKVGDDPDHPRRIKTIRSKGYLFVAGTNDDVHTPFH